MAQVELCRDLEQVRLDMCCLYLPGGQRPAEPLRRHWPQVESIMREGAGSRHAVQSALRGAGFWLEASLLDQPALVAWASRAVQAGSALTSLDFVYPAAWLAWGGRVPPVFWRSGTSEWRGEWVAVVGSREPGLAAQHFAGAVAQELCSLGFGVASGGALGCDATARESALAVGAPLLELWPSGVLARPCPDGALVLSARPPWEPFSRAAAMERNALLYMLGAGVVAHARYKEGGAWAGASDALRRRLGRVIVHSDGSIASRALVALGAVPLHSAAELCEALAAPARQARLAL